MKAITRVLALTLALSASTLWAQAEETIPQPQPTAEAQTENPTPTAVAPPEIRQAVGAVVSVSSTSLLLNSDAGAQLNFVADDKSTVPTDLKANDRVSVDYTERTDGTLHAERVSLVTAAPQASAAVASESPEVPLANTSALATENPPEATLPPTLSDEPRPLPPSAPAQAAPRQTHSNSVKAAPELKVKPTAVISPAKAAKANEVPRDSEVAAQSTLPAPSVVTPPPSTVAMSTETEPIPPSEGTNQASTPPASLVPVDAKPATQRTAPMRMAFPALLLAGGLAFLTFLGVRQARHEA